jgi:hypothetical protein
VRGSEKVAFWSHRESLGRVGWPAKSLGDVRLCFKGVDLEGGGEIHPIHSQ